MKTIKKYLAAITFYGVWALGTLTAYAEGAQGDASATPPPPTMDSFNVTEYLTAPNQVLPTNIAEVIVRLINQLSLVIGSFALLTIIVGGITLLSSAGREQPLTRGKDMIKFAIIGLIVAFGAYFMTAFVQSIFYDV